MIIKVAVVVRFFYLKRHLSTIRNDLKFCRTCRMLIGIFNTGKVAALCSVSCDNVCVSACVCVSVRLNLKLYSRSLQSTYGHSMVSNAVHYAISAPLHHRTLSSVNRQRSCQAPLRKHTHTHTNTLATLR